MSLLKNLIIGSIATSIILKLTHNQYPILSSKYVLIGTLTYLIIGMIVFIFKK